jgi:hypothetical protein
LNIAVPKESGHGLKSGLPFSPSIKKGGHHSPTSNSQQTGSVSRFKHYETLRKGGDRADSTAKISRATMSSGKKSSIELGNIRWRISQEFKKAIAMSMQGSQSYY